MLHNRRHYDITNKKPYTIPVWRNIMTLQQHIQADLKNAMKAKEEARLATVRIILGEFQRQPKKELSDQEVIAIIRKLVKSEEEIAAKGGKQDLPYLEVLQSYLPKEASEDEIRLWITGNIDFSQFKNKMQAMRPIMAHFAGTVDGNVVKKILNSLS